MIEIYKYAEELPAEWDEAAGSNSSLRKDFLALLERVNPCRLEYAVFRFKNKKIQAILVKYVLKIDIFCYSRFHFYLPITIIGIPCSVSESGYSFSADVSEEGRAALKEYLTDLKGAKLILNAAEDWDFLSFTKGFTLPSCIMDVPWRTFEEYLHSLRSHYRYRYKKAIERGLALSIGILQEGFAEKHYRLYEQVYNKSLYKLEKLSIGFFREAEAIITEFKKGNEPVAFVQYRIENKRMTFLFGGLDYSLNAQYALYQNMLLYLIRVAIENNCVSLNLGQTAEEVKCKLGAMQEKKYLYIHHHHKGINWIIKKFHHFFSYQVPEFNLRVFKGSDGEKVLNRKV